MFEAICGLFDSKETKERKLKKEIDDSFTLCEKDGKILIMHFDDAIRDVTTESTEDIIKILKEMRKVAFENYYN